jgi:plastocyanin
MNHSINLSVLLFALSVIGCDSTDGATDADTDATGALSGECGTIHDVTTTDDTFDMELYMDFTPEDLTIAVGDCVNFIMSDTHNAIEVSEDSYNNRDGTPLEGGFGVQFGETLEVYFGEAGTHFYVCQPHISTDMIGTITVE